MKIRTRIFLGVFAVLAAGLYLFVRWIANDLEPQYRKATEEPLADAAQILAAIASETVVEGNVNVEGLRQALSEARRHPLKATIFDYEKTGVEFRIYVADAKGVVRFDSYDGRWEGQDFSKWNDVARALRGEYGARTSLENPADPSSKHMYVAAPIVADGRIVGTLSVGKPTRTAKLFASRSRRKIVYTGLAVFSAMIVVVVFLSLMVTHPIKKLTDYARAVRDGERVQPPGLGKGELGELGAAFEEMRDALEGRRYIERYVQALAHEIKGPLAGLRGAADLLQEEMPPGQRARFVGNIRSEAARMQSIIDSLLLLSSLETRKGLGPTEPIDLGSTVEEAIRSTRSAADRKRLRIVPEGERTLRIEGDPFLIRHAVANLLQNAIDFSPEQGEIRVALSAAEEGRVTLVVRDHGPGIPEYATDKVFDRFYSLERPDTGKKSSGLGLSLVREIAGLHRGSVSLSNAGDGGAVATLSLPVSLA
jgi:two-component system sensor histidine kinase CreC